MAFRNVTVEIAIGNVESRILGPVPVQLLDRALNPHLPSLQVSHEGSRPTLSCVFEPWEASFLTGALPTVKRTLRRAGVRFRVRDRRHELPRAGDGKLAGWELRDYQQEVVDEAVRVGHGIIDIGTSGGKTILAAATIARLGLPALYLVTTRTLLHQTVEALERYLGVRPGIVGDGICDPKPLTVGLVQGVALDAPYLSQWRGGTLVFDEGHHAAARTFLRLVRTVAPRHHYYLSAVPFRTGGDQVVLDALAGRSLTGRRYSASFLVENGYACPVEVRMQPCRISGAMHEKPFAALYREFIAENRERNARVAAIAASEADAGRSVLILVERIRHGEALRTAIQTASEDVVVGSGPRPERLAAGPIGKPSDPIVAAVPQRAGLVVDPLVLQCGLVHGRLSRTQLAEITGAFREGRLRCLVATAGLFQEGVSIDGIEVLIQGGGLKSKAKVIQAAGRGMRLSPGKSACTYYDFLDDDEAGVFRGHACKRIAALKEEGFFVAEAEADSADLRGGVGSGRPRASREHDTPDGRCDAGAADPSNLQEPVRGPDPTPSASSYPGLPRPDGFSWFHVQGTKRFLLVDDEGRTTATAVCLKKALVPPRMCKKCQDTKVCQQGGRVLWQGE